MQGYVQFCSGAEFYHPEFLTAGQFPALDFIADNSPGNRPTDLPDNQSVLWTVGSDQFQVIGLIDPAGLRIHCVFVFAFFVGDFFDFDIARSAQGRGKTSKTILKQRLIALHQLGVGLSPIGAGCSEERQSLP
jgi:hypothetical protein